MEKQEMFRTFNMGIGFTLILAAEEGERLLQRLGELGEKAYRIGSVVAGGPGVTIRGPNK